MSEEEQQAAIGRTVQEYAACRAKLSALQSEAHKLATNVSQVTQGLTSAAGVIKDPGNLILFMERSISGFPVADTVLTLVREISGELEKKQTLALQLKNMGIEPRD